VAAGRGPLDLAAAYALLATLFAAWPAGRETGQGGGAGLPRPESPTVQPLNPDR
jgi:hypothetical protein